MLGYLTGTKDSESLALKFWGVAGIGDLNRAAS